MCELRTKFADSWKDYGVKYGLDTDEKCVDHAIRSSLVTIDIRHGVFDWKRYLHDNTDIQTRFMKMGKPMKNGIFTCSDVTCHYLFHGINENRPKFILGTNEPYVYDFDWKMYDKLNPDVFKQRDRGDNIGMWHCFRHWCEYGYTENRKTGNNTQISLKNDASISTDEDINKQWRQHLGNILTVFKDRTVDELITNAFMRQSDDDPQWRLSYYPLVVMPTYNRAANIERSIQMMLNQTEKKWTFLIIDDGSTVENKTAFKSIQDKYKGNNQIVFLENDKNQHIAFTLNRGIQYFLQDSKFTHFTWVSDDNEYYPTFLEKLYIYGKDFTYSWWDIINRTRNGNGEIITSRNPLGSVESLLNGYIGCASFLWSKHAISKIGIYNENLPGCEDYEYMIRTFKSLHTNDIQQVKCSLMQYVRHPDSEFEKHKIAIKQIEKKFVEIYKKLYASNSPDAFIYYSKTKYDVLFQRPHQIMRFYDKSQIKCFIGITNTVIYEEKYNLLIVPYELRECVYNALSNKNITTYYTDTRLYNEVIDRRGRKLYDLIDAPIEEFTVWKPNLEKCVKNSDCVMYSHPDLIQFLNEIDANKTYHYISNACDYEHFSKARERIGARPVDFPSTDKPILGYYGAFAQWLDFDIIRKHADEGVYQIVMIGGIVTSASYNLRFDHPNITWLAHKSYDELPYYLSWFDKCFLPFKDCELTTYVNPCKLWEYMASEKEIIKYNVNMHADKIVTYDDVCKNIKLVLNDVKKIAILIPCYNENPNYLEYCINSAISIDYEKFDIILLDDGSIDKTIFEKYSDKIMIFSQENKQLPTTLNILFTIAKKYDYVLWGSSDNIWDPNFIKSHLQYHSKDVDITYSNYSVIDENNLPLKNCKYRPYDLSSVDKSLVIVDDINLKFKEMINKHNNFIGASYLINSRVFSNIEFPYVNAQGIEDFIFWIEAYTNNFKFLKINENLYYYRYHSESMSGQSDENYFNKNMILYKVNALCACIADNKYVFSRKIFYENINTQIHTIINSISKQNILDNMWIFFGKYNKWFYDCFEKWANKTDIITIKNIFSNIKHVEDCKFVIPTPLYSKKIKVLLLTQNFSKGGLENVMILNSKSSVCDVQLSSFENSNDENVISFNKNIENVISYVNSNNIDIVNLHYITFDISSLKLNTKSKLCMTNHNTYYWFNNNMRKIFKKFNESIDCFINVSSAVKEFNTKYLNNNPKKSIIINNGCDIYNNEINSEICEEFKNKIIYICVASLFADKGQFELVKAFDKFYHEMNNKNIILILLGKVIQPEYLEKINLFIQENNINYIYIRECSHKDVNTYLNISDTFILPSYLEGCSQAIKEAIIKNKKIIISENVGSNNYLYNKYNNIFLIKNVPEQKNIGESPEKYYNFLIKSDKQEIINNIYTRLIDSSKHVVNENNNVTDIDYTNMNKKIDLVYFGLLKNNFTISEIFA